MGVEIYIVRLF